MKGIFRFFLFLCAASTAAGCFDFGSNPVFPVDSEAAQEVVQEGEVVVETPQDEPEGGEEEEGIRPDLPGEPDVIDVRPEDVSPPDFPLDFPPDLGPDDIGEVTVGACTNSADQAVIDSVDVQSQTVSCILSCTSDVTCLTDCISENTGLSEACSACFGEAAICIYSNCLAECMSNPESEACMSCREESGCNASFEECSGMTDF